MLKAVIFDLDNTLYSYDDAHAAAWQALTRYAGEKLSLSPEVFEGLHRDAFDLQKRRAGAKCAAIHNRLLRCQMMLEMAGLPLGHASRMAELYWKTLIESAVPEPGALQTMKRLKEMGLTIGIGTNMTAYVQYLKLEKLGLLRYVDCMVTSEEVNAEKPDAKFYTMCVMKAGCEAAECAFVGDSLKGDIVGALEAGMQGFWYCPKPKPEPMPKGAHRIESLEAILEWITP